MPPLQRRIAVAGVLVAAIAIAWLLARHREPAEADVKPPRFVDLTARRGEASRPVASGGELSKGERLDFALEVFDLCFVYVLKVRDGHPSLAWGHQAQDTVWSNGVYAPDWKGEQQGLAFDAPGEVALYAVASPKPLVGVADWDVAALERPGERCPRCGVSKVHVTVR